MAKFPDEIILKMIKDPDPVEITYGDAELLNSFYALPIDGIDDIIPILKEILFQADDRLTEASRAFDAIMKIDTLDKITFLIELYDTGSDSWRWICCEKLGKFNDQRAIDKLCEALLHNPDADDRYCAAEALFFNGNETAIKALEHARDNDLGSDYEGFMISKMASEAIQAIQARNEETLLFSGNGYNVWGFILEHIYPFLFLYNYNRNQMLRFDNVGYWECKSYLDGNIAIRSSLEADNLLLKHRNITLDLSRFLVLVNSNHDFIIQCSELAFADLDSKRPNYSDEFIFGDEGWDKLWLNGKILKQQLG